MATSFAPVSPACTSPAASATTLDETYRHPTDAGVISSRVPGPGADRMWRVGS